MRLFITEKSPYCSNDPTEATANSVAPNTFTREVGDKVPLTCKEGYRAKPEGNIQAICTASTPQNGLWKTSSICEGNYKQFQFNYKMRKTMH